MLKYNYIMDDFVRRPKRPSLNDVISQNHLTVNRVSTNTDILPEPAPVVTDRPKPTQKQEPDPFLPSPSKDKKPKRKIKFSLPKPKTKLHWILLIIAIIIALALTGLMIYWFIFRDTSPPPAPYIPPVVVTEPTLEPTTIASRMSGRQIPIANPELPTYAVQIENSPEARPQSGLKEADIVSEAVAEGGITRFNAIFHDNLAANIGPIRSLRPYYIDWFLPYGAPIVHAGGSAEALSDIRTLGIQDMDNTAGYFRRVSNRYAPHNLYSTSPQLLELFAKRGYKNPAYTGLPRKEAAPAEVATANVVNLKISSALYNVVFTYDKASNTYLRAQGGTPHVDAESGTQLAPNVVIVPVMTKGIHPDRVHTRYGTVGSGQVFVFQDGVVTKGTWAKASRSAQWQITDAAGAPIKLNPGQTWFTMIDKADSVTIQ